MRKGSALDVPPPALTFGARKAGVAQISDAEPTNRSPNLAVLSDYVRVMYFRRVAIIAYALAMLSGPAAADVSKGEMDACKRTPDVACLADIGFALAMEAQTYPHVLSEIDLLAQIGRVDDAHALAVRSYRQQGATEASAEARADFHVQDFRAIAFLRDGGDPWDDFSGNPVMVFAKALDLIGMGTSLQYRMTTDPQRLEIVRDWAENQLSSTRQEQLIAVDFLARVGDQDTALHILDNLKNDASRPTTVTLDTIRILGHERIFDAYQSLDGVRPMYYVDLARAVTDPDTAQDYLARMISDFDEDGARLYRTMALVVEVATELGLSEFAEDIASQLEKRLKRQRSADALVPLARAQLAIGVNDRAVHNTLKRVRQNLKSLPEHERITVAWIVAEMYAQLDDVVSTVAMLDIVDDPVSFRWSSVLTQNMQSTTRDALLVAAKRRFTAEEYAALRARIAAGLASDKKSREDNARARDMAWALLDEAPALGTNGYFYDNILKAAERLEDEDLVDAALSQSARRALDDGRYALIIQAAHQHNHMARW